MTTPFIIADIGTNHRGDLALAKTAIERAHDAGASAAKFQLYSHLELYGLPGEMPFTMPPDWVPKLAEHATKVGIEFMCTAFSPNGVAQVDPYVRRHKLASAEFTHVQMIDQLERTRKPLIASTGGVGRADVDWFMNYARNCTSLTLLECVARYPSPPDLYDVSVLTSWSMLYTHRTDQLFAVGLSDHTIGSAVACAAVARYASVIEKHFDPDPAGLSTPDYGVSLPPIEFSMYVKAVRAAASAVGSGEKMPKRQPEMALQWRRRIIAIQAIKAGERLVRDKNYGIYRSLVDDLNGMHGREFGRLNDKFAKIDFVPGQAIGPRDFVEEEK